MNKEPVLWTCASTTSLFLQHQNRQSGALLETVTVPTDELPEDARSLSHAGHFLLDKECNDCKWMFLCHDQCALLNYDPLLHQKAHVYVHVRWLWHIVEIEGLS